MSDIIFADGFTFDRREGAPDFVVGRLSIKVNAGKIFLDTYKNDRGFVNLNIKQSKKGGYYIELDTWKPNQKDGKWQPKPEEVEYPEEDINDDDIPF